MSRRPIEVSRGYVQDEWARAVALAREGGRIEKSAAGGNGGRALTVLDTAWQELTRLELPAAAPLTVQTSRADAADESIMPRASSVLVRGKLQWGIENATEECEFDFHEGRTMRLCADSVRCFARLESGTSAGVQVLAQALIGPDVAGSAQAPTFTSIDVSAGVPVPVPRRAAAVRLYTGAGDLAGANYGNTRIDFYSVGAFARAVPSGPGEAVPIPWPTRYVQVATIAGALVGGTVALLWELQL